MNLTQSIIHLVIILLCIKYFFYSIIFSLVFDSEFFQRILLNFINYILVNFFHRFNLDEISVRKTAKSRKE